MSFDSFFVAVSCERPLKDRLRTHYEYLVSELRVSIYVDALYGAEVLSDEDKEQSREKLIKQGIS